VQRLCDAELLALSCPASPLTILVVSLGVAVLVVTLAVVACVEMGSRGKDTHSNKHGEQQAKRKRVCSSCAVYPT
jgi:hypothetical protein